MTTSRRFKHTRVTWDYELEIDLNGASRIVHSDGRTEELSHTTYDWNYAATRVQAGYWVETTVDPVDLFRAGKIDSFPSPWAEYSYGERGRVARLRYRNGVVETSTGHAMKGVTANHVAALLKLRGDATPDARYGDNHEYRRLRELFPELTHYYDATFHVVPNTAGLRVGCHQFPWEDLEYVLQQLRPVTAESVANQLLKKIDMKYTQLCVEHSLDFAKEVADRIARSYGYYLPTEKKEGRRKVRSTKRKGSKSRPNKKRQR